MEEGGEVRERELERLKGGGVEGRYKRGGGGRKEEGVKGRREVEKRRG